ncbi:hypothetical protein, partial [Thioalkalivibrio sp.]|uniref:hypothetical protein n=1 Tax=Thioalkalivibrio sp. TaxID=2093813 RepID=UPI0012D68727
VLAEDVLLDADHALLGHPRRMCMRRTLPVVEVVSRPSRRLGGGVSMVMAGAVTMMGIVVVRMGVHRTIGVTVFVLVRLHVLMFVPCPMAVLPRVVVRMAVLDAVPMTMRMRMLVPVAVRLAVPVFTCMIVDMGMHRAVGMTVHVLVPVLMLMPGTMFVLVHVVVGVAVHRAVGMAMLVLMGAHRPPFHPRLAFSATAYRAHR